MALCPLPGSPVFFQKSKVLVKEIYQNLILVICPPGGHGREHLWRYQVYGRALPACSRGFWLQAPAFTPPGYVAFFR